MKKINKTKHILLPLAAALACLMAVGCEEKENNICDWEWWRSIDVEESGVYTKIQISWQTGQLNLFSLQRNDIDSGNAINLQFHMSGDTLTIDTQPYLVSFKVTHPSDSSMLWTPCGNRLHGTQNPNYLFIRTNPIEL